MTNSKECQRFATTVAFQLLCMAVSAVLVLGLIMYEMRSFRSFDAAPQIFSITPEKARMFGGDPALVSVGLTINNFSVFDTLANDFAFAGTLWFEFDPSMTSLDAVKKVTFEKGEVISLSEPSIKIVGQKLFVTYDIRLKKKDNLSHVFFPFSGHRIHIVIDNKAAPSELVFSSSIDDFKLADSPVTGWDVYSKKVETGYSVSELKAGDKVKTVYHPRVLFTIEFMSKGIRQLLTILFPLILIFYISVFTFSIDPRTNLRSIISLSSASVTGLIAFRFVIENLSPKVTYFMISDYLFFLFLGASCAVFFVNARSLELCARTKEYITILLHAVVVGFLFYVLHVGG